ncbi:TIGR04540 family protein [Alicyclobacillus mengziensis]|uniref:TIGR04540 family protein n=1 Tax=Alicyclobacillus mengziensis TaxID=2931921 RepID=A0A9X7Z6W6_9BACL|nr:TIGR04540 family protein [Alicyclobacillus mengziensis]QSO48379.1 TIGR04540 family protein [Alicyclobacillus mengziensis]
MSVKLFYKTQRELAISLNSLVDAYWQDEVDEEVLFKNVQDIYTNNQAKVLKNGGFTTVLRQQCGKRRLVVIERILHLNGLLQADSSSVPHGGTE